MPHFFLTTAIDYTNGAPHIGHAYEKVLGDVIARYHRLKGEEVFFLTGVDQHGQKVQQSAEKQGVAPQEFVDGITAKFRALWEKLDVRYDEWAATTDELHKRCVRAILQRLWDEGQLYKDKRAGYYSVRQEQFLTDKERGPDGEFGSEWGEVVLLEEENYYFKLAEHRDWLLALIDSRADLVLPEFRRGELRNAVEKLAGDLCVSRPKARLTWGIEFPFDPDFVTYVWFDALVNYISFAGYDPTPGADLSEFKSRWPALHVIGKDILIPAHGIYWPIMLKALGFTDAEMPQLLVHGWWNISGAKMSKSLGNVIDPDALADKYGAEVLRYYLMSDIATGKDADFSEERLVQRYNSDLANSLGNLLNRTLSMAAKYRAGRVKLRPVPLDGRFQLRLERYNEAMLGSVAAPNTSSFSVDPNEVSDLLGLEGEAMLAPFSIHRAIEAALSIVGFCNRSVQREEPWELAKRERNADTEAGEMLDGFLYHLAESLRIIAILISPILPKAAMGMFAQLNWDKDQDGNPRPFRLQDAQWGGLPDGHVLGQPTPLFPRIEQPPVG